MGASVCVRTCVLGHIAANVPELACSHDKRCTPNHSGCARRLQLKCRRTADGTSSLHTTLPPPGDHSPCVPYLPLQIAVLCVSACMYAGTAVTEERAGLSAGGQGDVRAYLLC